MLPAVHAAGASIIFEHRRNALQIGTLQIGIRRLSLDTVNWMIEATISLVDSASVLTLFGARDQHVRQIRDSLRVNITHREGKIRVAGDEASVARATEALEELKTLAEKKGGLEPDEVRNVLFRVRGGDSLTSTMIDVQHAGQVVKPLTSGQDSYIAALRDYDLVFATGPAGTGKTYLAVAVAVEALKNQQTRKIVLVRPAVEAGESLGFLPGDLQAKINPYLRPLLDALREMMDYDQIKRYTEQDVIEMIPLAYMRGRTLNESFIILDEAQNTTVPQMKMFLTRMGRGSKVVVSGDITQVDLPTHTRSGMSDALTRLKTIEGFCSVELTRADIVRHPLVQEIVRAYDENPRKRR